MSSSLTIQSRRLVGPDGVAPGAVHVEGATIVGLAGPDAAPRGELVDVGDAVLMPGLIDVHVHVNEPGRTDWEGYRTATRAAVAGGITTLIDMPLNCIPATTSVAALDEKMAAADGQLFADVGLWGGLVPGNLDELGPMLERGVFGFKCFLVDSGVPEFPAIDAAGLAAGMQRLAELGSVLLVHAEDDRVLNAAPAPSPPWTYAQYVASRPPEAEQRAIERLIEGVRRHGTHVHIVHLSAAGALEALAAARAEGLPITVETCPHYLTLATEEVPAGHTEFKCAPPIRDAANRDALWRGLQDGTIDFVAADHSPSPPAGKALDTGDFAAAWGGISGLQLTLAATWTEARERGLGVESLSEWMSASPAEFLGLDGRKGALVAGADADLVAWDPEASWTVDAAALEHRHRLTPYQGRTLFGRVRSTWLRGTCVRDETGVRDTPMGRLLTRSVE